MNKILRFLTRKAQVPGSKPAPENHKTDYIQLRDAITPEKPEFIEPWTLARARLEGKANDVGAVKAARAYNAHKTQVQNQWINPLQGINSGFGNAHNAIYLYQPVNYYECYILAQDPLFTKIFNMLSQSSFSKGGDLVVPDDMDEDTVKSIEKTAIKFNLWKEVIKAVRSQYVTGGCLLYMDFGLSGAELERPLNLQKIDCRRFRGFRHIDPINVVALDVNTVDVSADDYMQPKKWYVIGLGTVDASHFLKWEANPPELPMRPMTMYFGMPLTQLIKQDVANANMVSQGVANMVNRFRLTYMKTDESNYTTDNVQQFVARMQFMERAQNNFNVCPLKSTDEVLQLTTSLAGLAENVEGCYLQICAKTNIPYTELMGKSAQGMDATGAGDRRKWYDQCRLEQDAAKPNILKMYGICAGYASDKGDFITFEDYTFNPLEEASEKEMAENIRSYAEVASKLIEVGAKQEEVFEWLKSFKQFHLDNVTMDELADDGNPFDDDPNGGGTDITDDVLAKLQNEWQESKHPRDKDGKFGTGGGAQDTISDVFGDSFSKYSGRPDAAIQKLLWEKKGHVPAALHKEGVGDIDLVWGEEGPQGYGLAHIIERRNSEGKDGIEFVKSIPNIIETGTVDFRHQKLGRLYITSRDKNVVIRLDWNGIERNWLATAFEIYK